MHENRRVLIGLVAAHYFRHSLNFPSVQFAKNIKKQAVNLENDTLSGI